MDFGEVLTRAWQIIWKHKVLWIFGILASCASTNGSPGNAGSGMSWQTDQFPYQIERAFNQIPDWQIAMFVGMAILVGLVLVILAIFLGTIGKIGLVRGTLQAEKGIEKLTFGELFSGSTPYFWRVFLLNLLVGLGMFVIGFIIAMIVIFGSIFTLGLGLICLIPLICLFIPFAWAVGVVLEQSIVAIVAEDLGVMDGLKRGWEVVKLNAGSMILMWLILVLGIGLIGGLIIGLPLMLTFGPIVATIFLGSEQAIWGGLAVAAVCFVAYLPFLILLSGIMRSYVGSAWTLTFLRLTSTPEVGDEPEALPEAV
jgi:hypothetical protein